MGFLYYDKASYSIAKAHGYYVEYIYRRYEQFKEHKAALGLWTLRIAIAFFGNNDDYRIPTVQSNERK